MVVHVLYVSVRISGVGEIRRHDFHALFWDVDVDVGDSLVDGPEASNMPDVSPMNEKCNSTRHVFMAGCCK